MLSNHTDEKLMLLYANNNAAAFEELYLRYKGAVYRYFLRSIDDSRIAEELHQELWLKVINAREGYQVSALFKTWLFKIAHNRLIDYFRKHAKQQESYLEFDSCDTPGSLQTRTNTQPYERLELQRKVELLLSLISELPTEQRDVFLLREEAGLNIIEISEVTQINPETIKSRLRYAHKKLRSGMSL